MDPQMMFQRICAWSGVIYVSLFFGAFAVAGRLPPLSPNLPAADVTAQYQEHLGGIRVGVGAMLISGAFYAIFTGLISAQMRRIPASTPPSSTPSSRRARSAA